ncbi:hypothetical protein [Floricoccus penangensis]|uniref:hypothetical protein n=1 Tax=Floricoccus penangensis TaxID=1859475 RepID=UPI00203D2D3C|nr:hypothetical protein [Floricoccus penangensis]URZ86640.1 hypothetical protein KIW23_05955 [Floricoccus penangensis]
MKNSISSKNSYPTLSIICFLLGLLCWIPNLFFYDANNPSLFIFLTPVLGALGIYFAIKCRNKSLKNTLIVLNGLIACSIGLVFFIGTLIWGP